MPMTFPHRTIRDVGGRLIIEILRTGHLAYFSDVPFVEAVEAELIVIVVMIAELDGNPFTTARLARDLQMPRPTLIRRIAYLEKKGALTRDEQSKLRISRSMIASPAGDRSAARVRQLIVDAAKALSDTRET